MTTRTHLYDRINAILLAVLFAGSAWAYGRLPERIPMHFGLNGQPDRWEARSPASWFFLPLVAAALALGLRSMSRYSVGHPELWNLPDKRRFLALDPAAQAPIIQRMQEFLAFVGVMVTAVMMVVQASVYAAATGRSSGLPVFTFAGIGAAVAVMVVAGGRLNARVGAMVRDAHGRAAAS